MANAFFYAVTVLVWGGSWLAIKYQLGVVPPEVSLLYRMAIAAVLMAIFCRLTGRSLRLSAQGHLRVARQGLLLFSVNYLLIYYSSAGLTSGLVAVLFSFLVVFNLFGQAWLFKTPIEGRMALGAALGLAGIGIVFWPEVSGFDLGRGTTWSVVLCLAGTFCASAGMLTSAANQKAGLRVIETNSLGMAYGAGFMLVFCIVNQSPITFEPTLRYTGALLFLGVFSTAIGFFTYLTLLGRIGADRAAYVSVLFPLVALALSAAFEDFQPGPATYAGVALVLLGNALVLKKKPRAAPSPS